MINRKPKVQMSNQPAQCVSGLSVSMKQSNIRVVVRSAISERREGLGRVWLLDGYDGVVHSTIIA